MLLQLQEVRNEKNLIPKRREYRKSFRADCRGIATSCNQLDKGDFGLKALEPMKLNSRQAECLRRTVRRVMSRSAGLLWLRFFPFIPESKKPLETRMGSGKAPVKSWVAPVQAGRIILEIAGVSKALGKKSLGSNYTITVRIQLYYGCGF